jgi:hypothetical protein
MNAARRFWLKATALLSLGWLPRRGSAQADPLAGSTVTPGVPQAHPFGAEFPDLDSLTTGSWWNMRFEGPNAPPAMDVPRHEVVAFALYTIDRSTLKLTAQLFPLKPGEPGDVRLEVQRDGRWIELARASVVTPGWSAHFRIDTWDSSSDVPYRVRHGERAMFEGLLRRDPIDKEEIVVANMSCNSSRTTGLRAELVDSLRTHDPDLLFFGGDQTYRHTEHTAGWIEFGLQFRDILRDRPTVTIPDDHDVGQPNIWGENGKRSTARGNTDGGFFYPVEYINMLQRQQTWHLPDAVDPRPVDRGISVYFTRLRVGGIDFAILEDRKFKTGPEGRLPKLGPRPDHVNDPSYDPKTIDLPGLELLGARQMKFLDDWGQDWGGGVMKAVLSQTAFCGAVHLHGPRRERLLADLDCNGWPQSGRNKALEAIRRVWAVHLCGDQHLAVVVKHGITEFGDGPYGFTSPALVNSFYPRWWHPADERPGPNAVPGSPLPWTGDYRDGLGNRISMLAYANPANFSDEKQRGDGYGLVRFNKRSGEVTFECWRRFRQAVQGESGQYPGWPIKVKQSDNDGRRVFGWLPELHFEAGIRPVVQVIDQATNETLYTVRAPSSRFQPRVYSSGRFTVKVGIDRPVAATLSNLEPRQQSEAGTRTVKL